MRDMRGAATRTAEATLTVGDITRLLSRQSASTHIYVQLPDETLHPISIATNPSDSDELHVILVVPSPED